MKDFKLTKDFVRLNNIITDGVLKAFNWDTFEGPLSRYDLGDLLHQLQEPEIFGFYNNTAITPGENSKYSLISELLGLSRGIADLQATYDEWMTVIQRLRLPEQSFFDTYQRLFDHQCKTVKDLNGFWRMANEVKDKCAELGCAIEQVKEKYQLFDKMYLSDITKPRKRFNGQLGRGYEKEPVSYETELIEKWVMQGADRATVEAAFQPVNNGIPRESADPEAVILEFFGKYAKPGKTPAELRDILKDIRKCKTGSGIGEILKDILDLQRISLRKFVTHEKFPLHLCDGLEKKAETRLILYNRMHA